MWWYLFCISLDSFRNSGTVCTFLLSFDAWTDDTRIYNKRDYCNFAVIIFPHRDGNIPTAPTYGVYISRSYAMLELEARILQLFRLSGILFRVFNFFGFFFSFLFFRWGVVLLILQFIRHMKRKMLQLKMRWKSFTQFFFLFIKNNKIKHYYGILHNNGLYLITTN